MSTKATCGKHTTIASNPSVRVTRCACGTLHLTVIASGVTVQLKEETLRGIAGGLTTALENLDRTASLGTAIN